MLAQHAVSQGFHDLARPKEHRTVSGGYQNSERVLGPTFWSVSAERAMSLKPYACRSLWGEVIMPAYNSATVLHNRQRHGREGENR
jgi:hypothetical protein